MRNITSVIVLVLVIIGALNWLLIGVFSFDLVSFLFGTMSVVSRVVYGLVGLAGIWLIGSAVVSAMKSDKTKKA